MTQYARWPTLTGGGGGSGTVTSVGLVAPSFLTVTGSPVTTAGTLVLSLSGTALPVTSGGTGDTSFSANQVIIGGTTSTGPLQQVSGGTSGYILTSTGATSAPTWQAAPAGGVTSVAMTVPSFLSVSGSPITSAGTLAVTLSGTALPIANGGTAATSAASAYNNLSPMTTTGDIEYESGTNTAARLAIGTTGQVLTVAAGVPSWATPSTFTPKAPTVQTFLTGSGTYTRPSSPAPLYIKITMVGAGGGASASGSSGWGAATAGTASVFGPASAGGGGAGGSGPAGDNGGGAGGTSSLGSGPIGIALTGGQGGATTYGNPEYVEGPSGGSGLFGGAGSGTLGTAGGNAGATNTGGGGGAPSNGAGTGNYGGASGGSGGCVLAIINSPASTYSYIVGVGGSGGTAGGGGAGGGAGGSGMILVEEFYQ